MKLGIALGGGGAKGFALIGILEALEDAGIECEIVTGTSIGALVGAAYAAGSLAQLKQKTSSLGLFDILRILSPTLARNGVCSGRGVERMLREITNIERIEQLPKKFATASVALESGELICDTEGSLIDAVRSSISIPGVFTPCVRGNTTLVDGGLVEPIPVEACRRLGADFVIAIDLFADLPNREGKRFGLFSLLENSVGIAQQELTAGRFEKHPANFILKPNTSTVSILGFHKGEPLVKIGRAAMEEQLPALQEKIAAFNTT